MNTLLRKVHNSNLIENEDAVNGYIEIDIFYPAFDFVFNNCSLILISFDELEEGWQIRKQRINQFESVLRNILHPVTNSKHMNNIEASFKLSQLPTLFQK